MDVTYDPWGQCLEGASIMYYKLIIPMGYLVQVNFVCVALHATQRNTLSFHLFFTLSEILLPTDT